MPCHSSTPHQRQCTQGYLRHWSHRKLIVEFADSAIDSEALPPLFCLGVRVALCVHSSSNLHVYKRARVLVQALSGLEPDHLQQYPALLADPCMELRVLLDPRLCPQTWPAHRVVGQPHHDGLVVLWPCDRPPVLFVLQILVYLYIGAVYISTLWFKIHVDGG